jgi:hypothetical protein
MLRSRETQWEDDVADERQPFSDADDNEATDGIDDEGGPDTMTRASIGAALPGAIGGLAVGGASMGSPAVMPDLEEGPADADEGDDNRPTG